MIIKQLTYTGTTQTFNVPQGVGSVYIQAWGAAGGSAGHLGGPGGYSAGTLNVNAGDVLTVIVGQGGTAWSNSASGALTPTFGGGGGGGPCVEQYIGSSAGGRSGVRLSSGTEILTAGGGGGSDGSNAQTGIICAGPGGGTIAADAYITSAWACYTIAMGKGGTQTAGGAGGLGYSAYNYGVVGTAFKGGTGGGGSNGGLSAGSAGGGGGGYYGGGGGAGEYQAGLGCPISAGAQDCPGGGGSGYIGGVFAGTTVGSTIPSSFSATFTPPNISNPNYIAGVGTSSTSAHTGGNGLVVFTYTLPTLTKSVNESYGAIGDILTYTCVLNNDSGQTLSNIIFIDTIPNGTTFINNSLTVNGVQTVGSPNPPSGVSLNNLNGVITIAFNVQVTSIPSPNPVSNSATFSATGFSTSSNTVVTTINYLNINTSKLVSEVYGNIGDIIVYTIPITNTGNTTATNIILIDTIPNGTTFVASSLYQDSTLIVGSPNPPGVTLPNSLQANKTTTITFKVQVTTIPSPNPIVNSASINSSYTIDSSTTPNRTGILPSNTNIVSTQINNASLGGIIKLVDKSYASCGDIITYTINIPNSGSITAQNIVFKDTIPNGTVFVSNSLYINGTQQNGYNPSVGVTIPNIAAGASASVIFKVQVQC